MQLKSYFKYAQMYFFLFLFSFLAVYILLKILGKQEYKQI